MKQYTSALLMTLMLFSNVNAKVEESENQIIIYKDKDYSAQTVGICLGTMCLACGLVFNEMPDNFIRNVGKAEIGAGITLLSLGIMHAILESNSDYQKLLVLNKQGFTSKGITIAWEQVSEIKYIKCISSYGQAYCEINIFTETNRYFNLNNKDLPFDFSWLYDAIKKFYGKEIPMEVRFVSDNRIVNNYNTYTTRQ